MEIKRDIYLQKLISLLWDGQLTLPTDKSGGFSVQPPQPADARSYTMSPSVLVRT